MGDQNEPAGPNINVLGLIKGTSWGTLAETSHQVLPMRSSKKVFQGHSKLRIFNKPQLYSIHGQLDKPVTSRVRKG